MEDVHGRTIFDENSEVRLMAYLQDGVVLMPNQILPFYEDRPAYVAMLRTAVEEQKTIAVLHLRYLQEMKLIKLWLIYVISYKADYRHGDYHHGGT